MLGADHKALLLAVEHRFYGKSQPFQDWSLDSFKYFNTEQALADLANIIRHFKQDNPDRRVIVIGGSYPGALSAWFREKYPHLTTAAWSSSGVVYPVADMWQFDEQIYQATSSDSEACPQIIQDITKKVEAGIS